MTTATSILHIRLLLALFAAVSMVALDTGRLCAEPLNRAETLSPDGATDAPPGDEKPKKVSLSVTVAGGVSLGAYQAGYLYYLTEVVRENPQLFEFKMLTGASAGLINAVLTLMAVGNPEITRDEPTSSLFYRVWNEMELDALLDVDDAPPGALSSRKVLRRLVDEIETEWKAGLTTDLDMVLGASTTRLENRTVPVSKGFHAKTLEEKFVFRVQGRGKGTPPNVSNFVNPYEGLARPLLPFAPPEKQKDGHNVNFSIVRQILFASSAIPIVFLPQKIDYCMTTPELARPDAEYTLASCEKPQYSDLFADGGIVDRQPLRLAHRIARSGLIEAENGVGWRALPEDEGTLPDNVFFLYIDPRTSTFPEPVRDDTDELLEQTGRLFRSAGQLFKGVFRSAQSKELYTLVDEYPDIRKKIQLATHDFPTAGGLMANFFGFFDREIRRFDFFLGMRDAHHFVVTAVKERLVHLFGVTAPTPMLPDPGGVSKVDPGWQPYFCLLSSLDGETRYEEACHDKSLTDFRILTQVSLDRLYDLCRRFPFDPGMENEHCQSAMAGGEPPKVWGVANNETSDQWQRRYDDDENAFEHTMRLLELYRFRFRDLGLERDDAALGFSRIRAKLLYYVDRYADKLRYGDALALRILGKPAINLFSYAPPEGIFYLVMGTGIELASSVTFRRSRWFRFNFALQMQGFNLFLTSEPNAFGLTPLVGMEFEPLPLSSPLLQSRIGLRVGYQFSTRDKFLAGTCNTDRMAQDPLQCSAPLAQAFLALVFFERIRLQIGFEWFPKWLPPMSAFDKHLFNGIVEVGWQWISPF